FENVYVVPEQKGPDPDFTTLDYPNPEDPKAFTYALNLAKEKQADIVLATDPDADRLGIYAYDTVSGEYKAFTGNMSGMLIAEYILSERKKAGTLPKDPALVSTIVTTNMARAISDDYGLKFIEVLTGFKYIGEQIKLFEQNNSYNYVFGLEESYGCLAGTHARDKDAIVAVMCLCEVASYCKVNGVTLCDRMVELYKKYGFYKESQYTITLKGVEGAKKIKEIMDGLRSNPLKKLGNRNILRFRDYKEDVILDYSDGSKTKTGLPTSNVLYYELEDDFWCCARPSGTEPKLKFYIGVKGNSIEDAENKLNELTDALKADVKTD
ncbi:MAG: phospho-sugar mutase, partial [Lachnospiraceae bacterium]|nr:phospho-sugar mutase [Lachnospiraceae bacterium]